LAIPPSLFATVANGIAHAGMAKGARLIIEKPFGRDYDSAVALNATLHEHFSESAIFRIDHFVGKEALRSLLVTRFANAIVEPLWNRNVVSSVKITMAESFGVEDRGSFYDSVGAMRDVMQNHLLQMVALLAMEQPVNEHSKALRDEKGKVLEACRVVEPKHFVRGQYNGYLDVPGVAPNSDTETYAAFRLDIDSPRWSGVPFFLRAGKALAETVTEMTIEFKSPPRPLWIDHHDHVPNNSIRIEAKPENFAAITWLHKEPGETMMPEAITLAPPPDQRRDTGPEPYELLIEEAMKGDPTLFAREDSVPTTHLLNATNKERGGQAVLPRSCEVTVDGQANLRLLSTRERFCRSSAAVRRSPRSDRMEPKWSAHRSNRPSTPSRRRRPSTSNWLALLRHRLLAGSV
jgi:glucose-6-phosphate 1-dehydrogenase